MSAARKKSVMKNAAKRTRTARTKRKERSGDVVFSIVAIVVVFGSLLGTVIIQTFIVQNRVKLDAVNAELNIERERNQQLRLEVIELEAPKRILDTATSRLGMVRPEAGRTYLPGVDPNLVTIAQPPPGNPFGPAPLPESLLPKPEPEPAVEEAAPAEATTDETASSEDASDETTIEDPPGDSTEDSTGDVQP